MPNNFRISAYTAFLTYPQSGILDKGELMTYLLSLGDVEYCCVAAEKHQDGSPHLHAVIKYVKKINTTNPRYFDCGGNHPDYQKVINFTKSVVYIQKDGDFVEHGVLPSELDIFFDLTWN